MNQQSLYAPDLHQATREKIFYTLVMFPYPSGYGLHVGHASNFVINDVLARYKRQKGYTVFNPFGFDSFGLPTENYAMKLGKPAYEVTKENIVYFNTQTAALDLSFDTERTVVTSSPEYYKRTQWIFQQLYKAGLVYRDTLWVNRCPECQTVLANDQVIDGACERCKSEIIQKKHPQRFIKITAYADRLLADLDTIDRPEETKTAQRNWIGRSEGCEIDFMLGEQCITVFTTRVDTIYGVTALVLAPENTLLDSYLDDKYKTEVEEYRQFTLAKTAVQRQKDLKEKTGVFSGLYAKHPLTGEDVAIWYADYVLADYGTGAVMMVPAHDERDWEFAKKFGIPVKKVIARETGTKRDNEEFKNGGAAVIFDPKTQRYAIGQRPDGRLSLFAGGVDEGEIVRDAILREVKEESGLYDFKYTEQIETAYAHYFNKAKQVNRIARAECMLIILASTDTKEIALEDHEQFTLSWKTAEEIRESWQKNNQDGGYDHYLRFLNESVARAIVLGYDTTSNKELFMTTVMTEYGLLDQSGQFNGLTSSEAKIAIAEYLESIGAGRKKISYKLRDWSVSRQRYRGSPIPVYYDENNNPQLIPEEELPVVLPLDLENYKPTGKSPLEDHPTFPLYTPQNKKVPFQKWTRGVWNFHEGEAIMTRKTICAILYDPKKDVYGIISRLGLGQENYTFVLGGIDDGELSEDAAMREVYEETGYKNIRLVKKLGNFQTEFRHAVKKRNQHNITDVYLFELIDDEHDDGAKEENENLEFLWMTKEQILSLGQQEALRNHYLRLASGEYVLREGETIDQYNYYNPLPSYRRECDTLDTFMCSSFYFLRYPDANNAAMLGDPSLLNKCFPIDFYIGGKEHSVGHLLYARFIHKFLYDQGVLSCSEPFQRLIHQGMVLGADGRKMSKRRGNIIDPMEVIEKYGSDAVRTYLMFMGPVEQEKVWNDGALAGIGKFLARIQKTQNIQGGERNDVVERALHKAIKGISDDMELLKYNTAVSKLMIFLNTVEAEKTITQQQSSMFMQLLFPFAPQTARAIWESLGNTQDIEYAERPSYNPALLIDQTITLAVQINGKLRATLDISPDSDESSVFELAQQEETIKKYLEGATIRKVIYVQGKILNIVL